MLDFLFFFRTWWMAVVACGNSYSLFLGHDGLVRGIGMNSDYYGQRAGSSLEKPIRELEGITAISCAGYCSYCIDSHGDVWAFGNNNEGQLGLGNRSSSKKPKKISFSVPIVQVACSADLSLFLDAEGNVYSCGRNYFGPLGLGDSTNRLTPEQIPNLSNIQHIACGLSHSVFVTNEGNLLGSGTNHHGELGVAEIEKTEIPIQIPKVYDVIEVACGSSHTVALTKTGRVYVFGKNGFGQLGIRNKRNRKIAPQRLRFPSGVRIIAVTCNCLSSLFVDSEGCVWCCGANNCGGDEVKTNFPSKIEGLQDIRQIYGGYDHTICVDANKEVWGLGENSCNQLGVANMKIAKFPILLPQAISSIISRDTIPTKSACS